MNVFRQHEQQVQQLMDNDVCNIFIRKVVNRPRLLFSVSFDQV